nr:hypothetical protein [Tanacetum cinerariifolium]
ALHFGCRLLWPMGFPGIARVFCGGGRIVRPRDVGWWWQDSGRVWGQDTQCFGGVDKITSPVISEGTGDKPRVPDVTKDESTESELESWGNDEGDINDENELENEGNDGENKSNDDKTPSNIEKDLDSEQDMDGSESDSESNQQEYKEEVKDDDDEDDDKSDGYEDRGMDETTNQFSDDVQDKKADVEMTDAQQEKENLKITQEQVVKDAYVTITTVEKEFKVPDASISHSSDLASKFLNFSDIHLNDAEIVSPLDVHVHHEVPRIHTSTLLTVLVLVILEASHDKDEGPSVRSDRGLKKRKTRKDAEPTTSLKNKDSTSRSSKGTKSQPKSSRKSVHMEEPEFKVRDNDMPQGQEGNLGNHDVEPKKESASRSDWFIKPSRPQEPTDPKWNEDKTQQKGPTQSWLMSLVASTSTDKSLKDFDELMNTIIDFSSYILNGLKIKNLTQEILLGLAFRLLKGTRSNYAELEYDFEECYKDFLEKLD